MIKVIKNNEIFFLLFENRYFVVLSLAHHSPTSKLIFGSYILVVENGI